MVLVTKSSKSQIARMPEKLCIQWNDFQENRKSSFENLRNAADFANVTLACEDGQQIMSHKLILASSSPVLRKILLNSSHPHPMIYMRGVKSEDLEAIIDFIYLGKANIFHENIQPFLAIAEDLGLKGFWDPTAENSQTETGNIETLIGSEKEMKSFDCQSRNVEFSSGLQELEKESESNIEKDFPKKEKESDGEEKDLHGLMGLLDEKVKGMMKKGENMIQTGRTGQTRRAFVCKICGKEGQFVTVRDHIESNHLEGIVIPCSKCEKISNSRHTFRRHQKAVHKDSE